VLDSVRPGAWAPGTSLPPALSSPALPSSASPGPAGSAPQPAPPAVILAAGAGSRLREDDLEAPPKPLQRLAGRPILEHSLRTFAAGGVREAFVIVGYDRHRIVPHLRELGERLSMQVTPVVNPRWEQGNGTSVLAAAAHVRGPFYLAMCDHLFDPSFLRLLLAEDEGAPLSLVVDPDCESVPDLDEATKVRRQGRRIVRIGKDLSVYDAVDTGVFLARPPLFDALEEVQRQRAYSLSNGVQRLADRGEAVTVSSRGGFWRDIDTPSDLATAQGLLAQRAAASRLAG
jgi:1L-myo-inositol 1-phosphate cytidylyltransferase